MQRFRETWNDMTVRTTSPNGCVHLTNHGDRSIRISCDDAWFHRVELGGLLTQLERLFSLAFVERTKAYYRHKELVTGFEVTPVDASRSPHLQTFVDKRDALEVEGSSSDGLVHITSVGMRRFATTIDTELWSRRDRAAVERGLGEAATSLVADQFRKMHQLKQEGH